MRITTGLSNFTEAYDAFLVDAWGVIHNGFEPLPGVLDCLNHLKESGKRVIVLSNAARRAHILEDQMTEMGIPRTLYDGIVTSGEATWQALSARNDTKHANLGNRAYRVSADYHGTTTIGLEIEWVDTPEEADFVLFLGISARDHSVETYLPLLETMVSRNLTLVCANPDHVAIFGTQAVVCPGAVAERFEAMGGAVLYHGKPHPSVYASALKMLGNPDPGRVAGIGDALKTDVAGALNFGLDAFFVTGGIHADDIGPWPIDEDRLKALCKAEGHMPTYVLPAFNW